MAFGSVIDMDADPILVSATLDGIHERKVVTLVVGIVAVGRV